MKLQIAAIFAASLLMFSCKKEENKETVTNDNSIESVGPSAQNTTNQSPVAEVPQNATAALNPEHGLPGHRCDIPVGAPLNSTPSTPSPTSSVLPPSLQSAPVQNTAPVPASSTAPTTAGLNPEHGLPGHRCDIPVGAPLT